MKYNTKRTVQLYAQEAKPYTGHIAAIMFAIIIGDSFKTLTPYIYKLVFDTIATGADINFLLGLMALVLSSSLVHWAAIQAASFLYTTVATNVMRDLSNRCFVYLHQHSHTFFQDNFVGSLVKKVNRFSDGFESIAGRIIWEIFPIMLNVLLVVVVLSTRYWQLGVLVLFWAVVFCVVNYVFSQYKLKYDIKRGELDTQTTGLLADTITNQSTVKLFTGFSRETSRFAKITQELRDIRSYAWNLGTVFQAAQWFFIILLDVGIMYLAIVLWKKGILTIGDFLLIQAYLLTLFEKLWNFGRIIRDLYESLANAEEMTIILDTPHEVVDKKNATSLRVKTGALEFHDVSFFYNSTRQVLNQLSLTIASGEKIALVGPSGAGKSTITKLLLRVHDISEGHILIDGQDIREVTQESLHRAIGYVPQEPMLFHRTLLENIRYGKPSASKKQIIAAAKAARCHDFIMELPEGYETFVGERGIKLSGGERQRVAIARAMLKNAPILFLDEATSSLDSESEVLIQEALKTLITGKTVITIAHRLSTIMTMDRIIVIDKGKIIEEGTHEQLYKKNNGVYAQLWKHQAGGYL